MAPDKAASATTLKLVIYAYSLVPAETLAQTYESEILGADPTMWIWTSPCDDSEACSSWRTTKLCTEWSGKVNVNHCLTLVLRWKKLKRLNGRSHFVPIRTEMPTIKPYNIIWRKMNPYKCSLLDNWAIGRLSNQRFLITFSSSLKKTNS